MNAIRFLLEHGADANGDPDRRTKYFHNTPMRMLLGSYMRGQDVEKRTAIDVLLKYGARVPSEIDAAAMAVFQDDAPALDALVQNDRALLTRHFAQFDYGNLALHGATLLHMAADFGALSCIELLLLRGADPNARVQPWNEFRGHTPIFHAVVGNLPEICASLLAVTDLSIRGSFRRYTWPVGEDRWYAEVSARALCAANLSDHEGRPIDTAHEVLRLLLAHGAPEVTPAEQARAATAG